MNEAAALLQAIHDELTNESTSVLGSIDVTSEGLSLFDGRASLTTVVWPDSGAPFKVAHCHVITAFADDKWRSLDACVVGIGRMRDEAIRDAACVWKQLVAGPIFSLLHGYAV